MRNIFIVDVGSSTGIKTINRTDQFFVTIDSEPGKRQVITIQVTEKFIIECSGNYIGFNLQICENFISKFRRKHKRNNGNEEY